MLSIKYKLSNNLRLSDNESSPSIIIYACDTDSSVYSDMFKGPLENTVDVNIPSSSVSRSLCLCVDLYVNMKNGKSVPCNTRVAGTTINIYDSDNSFQNNFDMVNFSTGEIKATIDINVDGVKNLNFKPLSRNDINLQNVELIQASLDNYIKKQMDPFIRNQLKPSDRFLYHVHAPIYNTRVMRLPGASYYIIPDRVIETADESWCANWVKIALSRYDMTEKKFNRCIVAQFESTSSLKDEFQKCVSVVAEAACILVHSYTYKSDFTYTNSGKKTPIESFDNIFVTGAGDCEDSSKGIYTIVRIFSRTKFKSILMKNVQKICNMYIPFGVLAEVSNPSIHTTSASNNLAHMFTVMIPRRTFYRNRGIVKEHLPFERSLTPLLLEGTGRVNNSVSKSIKNDCNYMVNLDVPNTDQYIDITKDIPFYKKVVHLYNSSTDCNTPNILSYSLFNDENEYGVDFYDFFKGKFKVKDHEACDDNIIDLCKRIVNIDTPLLFKKAVAKKECFISSNVKSKTKYKEYTDLYTKGMYVDRVVEKLNSMELKFEQVLEFTDNIDNHFRIRVYK